ncbi:MAG: hypothetical protein NVS3B7_18870 [Candidatus Elarobacter sp.]
MRIFSVAARSAAFTLALAAAAAPLAAPAAVKAGTQTFEGTLVHVSAGNLKVKNASQQMTFLIVPRFGKVFKADGTTPVQVKDLHDGQLVKVYYDQKFLGRPHADRILVLNRMEKTTKKLKS